jgi:ElaB/YqjD/DUF883 family membrane-anchored ribosome-binding protein
MTTQNVTEHDDIVDGNNPEDIQRRLDQTQDRLDNDIDELDRRSRPGAIAADVADRVRDGAGTTFENVGRAVRENPVPALLIGAGVTWLALSALGKSQKTENLRRAASDKAGHAGSAMREKAGAARDKAGEIASDARERAGDVAQAARERAVDTGEKAKDIFESQPILVGALGLAVGAAIGASFPASARENEVVGPLRDKVRDQAAAYGRETIDKAGQAASDALQQARSKADEKVTELRASGS